MNKFCKLTEIEDNRELNDKVLDNEVNENKLKIEIVKLEENNFKKNELIGTWV